MEQKMVGHFLKWWAQAYQTNHSWHFGSKLYLHTDTDTCMHMYIDCWWYSKTFLKWPLKKEDQLSLNAGQKYCRMPALSYHMLLISLFFVFYEWLLKTCFTVLTTSMYFLLCGVRRLAVRWIFLLKWDFFTTKKDGSTALGSDGPYFEIMGQWPGSTINLKACSYNYITWGITSSNCPRAISDECWP